MRLPIPPIREITKNTTLTTTSPGIPPPKAEANPRASLPSSVNHNHIKLHSLIGIKKRINATAKQIIAIMLIVSFCFALFSCDNDTSKEPETTEPLVIKTQPALTTAVKINEAAKLTVEVEGGKAPYTSRSPRW